MLYIVYITYWACIMCSLNVPTISTNLLNSAFIILYFSFFFGKKNKTLWSWSYLCFLFHDYSFPSFPKAATIINLRGICRFYSSKSYKTTNSWTTYSIALYVFFKYIHATILMYILLHLSYAMYFRKLCRRTYRLIDIFIHIDMERPFVFSCCMVFYNVTKPVYWIPSFSNISILFIFQPLGIIYFLKMEI